MAPVLGGTFLRFPRTSVWERRPDYRIANRLLRRVRDVADDPKPKQVAETLMELGVDSWGMDDGDRDLLMLLFQRFQGGPVGVRTLAAAAGHEEQTLTEAFEPYLLRKGVLDVTERGRQLTVKGFVYCQEVAKRLGGDAGRKGMQAEI